MASSRVWLFRVLVLAAAGILLVSWFMPWWAADVLELSGTQNVVIRPWGFEQHGMGTWAIMLKGSELPAWFAPFMWTYLALGLVLLLVSMVVRDIPVRLGKLDVLVPRWLKRLPLPQWLIGGVGVSYIVAAVVAAIVAAIMMSEYGLSLMGYTFIYINQDEQTGIETSLLLGYWLAYVVGLLLIALALLRNRILGKTGTGA